MNDEPFQTDGNGSPERDDKGRFLNYRGPGAPANRYRDRIAEAEKSDDLSGAMEVFRECMRDTKAKWADRIAAADKLLDRIVGKAVSVDIESRIAALEAAALERQANNGRH